MNSIRPFSESRSRRIRSSERPFGTGRRQHCLQLALPVGAFESITHRPSAGSPSGRAPSRSRALVAPSRQSSARFRGGTSLVGGNVLVAPDADRAARALDAVARAAADGAHRPPFERELVRLHTMQLRRQSSSASRPCRAARPCRRLLALRPSRRDPAVHPPRRATARSRAGQASGSPIGSPEASDARRSRYVTAALPVGDHIGGLLAAQREVAERVALAVLVEQGAQLRLVVAPRADRRPCASGDAA